MAHSDRGITTTLCGTPGFIAPEQRTGRPYGAKVDVWGLGCVLYIMLSGMEPFDAAEDEQAFERSDAAARPGPPLASRSKARPVVAVQGFAGQVLTVDPDERIDAATILDHPFVRDGGRKNSYIGPSAADKIGSLVKQRRLSGGRAPPSLSAVVSADDDAPSSSAGSSPDDVRRGLPPEPPSSPVSDASGLDASLHGLEPPDASAVDAMGRDVVELDLASIDLASNGAIRRFPSHDKYGLDADRVFDPAAHRSVPLDQ
ncbi:serine/threonine kinase [Aureococcus anophagefferens]|nr:serine/threonine kinase [Aureococcus anophagefferens]